MTEWLAFIGDVLSTLAWPVAVVWLLLAYKKPVRKILVAVARRVADLEELNSPVGGAKFGDRVMEVSEKLQESIEDSEVEGNDPASGPSDEQTPLGMDVSGGAVKNSHVPMPTAGGIPEEESTDAAYSPDPIASEGGDPQQSPCGGNLKTPLELKEYWRDIFLNLRNESPLLTAHPQGSEWFDFESTILALAAVSPRAGVIEAWTAVEKSAERMVSAAFPSARDFRLMHRIPKRMHEMGLPVDWIDAFESLRRLRNYAAHEVEFSASLVEIRKYAATAWTLKEAFDDIASSIEEGRRVRSRSTARR